MKCKLCNSKDDYCKGLCRQCYDKEKYQINKDEINRLRRENYQKNRDKILAQERRDYQRNKEKILKANKIYYQNNKMKILEHQKEYDLKNKEHKKLIDRLYYEKHREREILKAKKWKENHREQSRLTDRLYERHKEQTNISYRIRRWYSCRVNLAIKNRAGTKAYKTIELLGCSIQQCREYLEKQFQSNMSWDNYGSWEIHHTIPCCYFDLKDKEQQKLCFHYTNLQPLWVEEHKKIGIKMDEVYVKC